RGSIENSDYGRVCLPAYSPAMTTCTAPRAMRPELEARPLLCRNLASPPAVALRIIELAQDPNADLAATARVIALDPALSARMLRVANSPLYAGRRKVENLPQALTL